MSWLYHYFWRDRFFIDRIEHCRFKKIITIRTRKPQKVIRLDETERFEQTYPLNANGRVSVSNVNGSITIETWERNEVKLEAVKTADSKERLAEVEIKIDAKADSFSVETDYDNLERISEIGIAAVNSRLIIV